MIKITTFVILLMSCNLVLAQNLVIKNTRIISGTGKTIEQGTVIVSKGKIVSVTSGNVTAEGIQIDAKGMTVLPGLIDTHRHDLFSSHVANFKSYEEVWLALNNETPDQLKLLLSEGFTTIMVPGTNIELSSRVKALQEKNELSGPRVLFAGPIFTAPGDHPVKGPVCQGKPFCASFISVEVDDPILARNIVKKQAASGVKSIKVVVDVLLVPDVTLKMEVLEAIVKEAHLQRLPVLVHAETVEDMIAVAKLGIDRLVHHPNNALISEGNGAKLLRDKSIPIATTVSYSSSQFFKAIGVPYNPLQNETILKNIRYLWDEGVIVAFGTDSPSMLRPIVEIQQLSKVLTPEEVITALTRNAAIYLDLDDKIGSLEKGKTADMLIVNGNPLDDVMNLSKVKLVIQNGKIVIDNR